MDRMERGGTNDGEKLSCSPCLSPSSIRVPSSINQQLNNSPKPNLVLARFSVNRSSSRLFNAAK